MDRSSCCVSVCWAGQQHEGSFWFTLRRPTRLHLWQSGVPHRRPSRLLCCGWPRVYLPCSPQLPLRRLQDWQWRVCTQGQCGGSWLFQTSATPLPALRPAPLLSLCVSTSALNSVLCLKERMLNEQKAIIIIKQLFTFLPFIVPASVVMQKLLMFRFSPPLVSFPLLKY